MQELVGDTVAVLVAVAVVLASLARVQVWGSARW